MTALRHRGSFSLRTLFVVVLGFCVAAAWIGTDCGTVIRRREARAQVYRDGGTMIHADPGRIVILKDGTRIGPATRLSLTRAMLGDQPILVICVGKNNSTYSDVMRVGEAFPEAKIYTFDEYPEWNGVCVLEDSGATRVDRP